MIKIKRLLEPKKTSPGTEVLPGGHIVVGKIMVKNNNNFPVWVSFHDPKFKVVGKKGASRKATEKRKKAK